MSRFERLAAMLALLALGGTNAARAAGFPAYHVEKVPYGRYLSSETLTVVASFDGSKSLERWRDILDFASKNKVHFTFFISGVYFLGDGDKTSYAYPLDGKQRGKSDIGFDGAPAEVAQRREFVAQAIAQGHDIESHLNGHFDGTRWPQDAWRSEFKQFNALTGFLPKPARHVRFPLLAMNHNAFPVLAEFGIRSITSVVESDYENFNRVTIDSQGKPYAFLEFPIAYEHENKAKIMLMDYNFYLYDETHKIDPAKAEKDMVALYLDEASRCMKDRRPFFISHHFSNWEHSAYWDAMKQVILTLKDKYQVEFLTVSELYEKLTR